MDGPLGRLPGREQLRRGRGEAPRLILCGALALLGCMVIAGWLLDIEPLKSVVPGLPTMKVNSALGFIAGAAGLAMAPHRGAARAGALGCAALLIAVGGATLLEYAVALDLRIDELLVRDDGNLRGSGFPGRMSPLSASAWVALGLAIALLARAERRWGIVCAHLLALVVGFIAFLAAAGYAFGSDAFTGIGAYTAIAVHTALGLCGLSAAALTTRAGEGWLESFGDSPAARALLAWMLPLAVAGPFLLGFLILLGSGIGAYNAPFGFALFTPSAAAVMVLVSIGAARRVRRGELALRRSQAALAQSEEALRALNETLEQRIAREVAERGRTEEALRQSQKLESIGQLTGGVAHDFNNLLTPIIGSLDLLLRRDAPDPRARRLIEAALQSAERARTLVQRLLAFARRQPLQPGAVDLAALVGNMAELIASTSGPRIALAVDLAPDLPPVLADANQLEMAILNLAVNGRDAMPDGGTLTLSACPQTVKPGERPDLAAGRYVRLAVADSGCGMDEAVLARAIEPFFSTKGVGHGTGLGLSMVHGLMAQLGGAMTIDSRPGLGTCVMLWLPVAGRPADDPTGPGSAARSAGSGTVLLVDDEPLVRASLAEMVAELGYEVVEAGNAAAALACLDSRSDIDLLVTDHLMPGMTGTELARAVKARFPGVAIVIVSGYADLEEIAPELPRLSKPFRHEELAALLARLVHSVGRM